MRDKLANLSAFKDPLKTEHGFKLIPAINLSKSGGMKKEEVC